MLPRSLALAALVAAFVYAQPGESPAERLVAEAGGELNAFEREPRIAVVVGIDDYREEYGFRKLDYAAKDAQAVAETLRAEPFKYDVRMILNADAMERVVKI